MNQRALSSYEYRLQDFPAIAMSPAPAARTMPDVTHSIPSARVLLSAVGFSVASWAGLAWLTMAAIHLVH